MLMPVFISGALPSVVHTDTGNYNAAATTTITFSSRALGAAGRRHIVVAVGWASGALTAVTVAGVSATSLVSASRAGLQQSAIWIASVPTGTTGNVVLTFGTSTTSAHVSVYAVYNLRSATAVDTASAIGTSASDYYLNLTSDMSARGVAVAVFSGNSMGGTPAPTGLSDEVVVLNIGAITRVHSAEHTATAAEPARNMGWTLRGNVAGCLATFR